MTDPVQFDPAEVRGGGLKQALPTLVWDAAMPVIVFNVLTHRGASALWALAAGGIFPALNIARGWIQTRRLEPLGLIVMAFLAVGTATSLISGSVFFALIKESFLTATFGLICLASLFGERPLLFYISRQFVAGSDPARLEWWNGLWQYEAFRSGMRFVTAMWGVVYMIEALARVGLAMALTPATVVVVSPIMAFAVTIAMIAWTRRYMLAMRERRMRALQLTEAG